MPHGDALVALVTLLLVLATVASIIATWKIAKSQEALQRRLAEDQRQMQERISLETSERHAEQRRFEQRAQLIPIWEYMASLREIDPTDPITPQVVKTVNTLELIALCKEAEIVDGTVILRAFRDKYVELYEAVKKCGPLKGYPNRITGEDLLSENHAATQLYCCLINERNNRDRPTSLRR
jgi:hypothetical protein